MPLEVGPADLRPVPWQREQIHQLFDTMQFRVLRDRLYTTLPNGITGPSAATATPADGGKGYEVEVTRLGPAQVSGWLSDHAATGRAGLAVSGSWGRGTGVIDGIAVAAADGAAAFIDPVELDEHDEQALAAWLADAAVGKAMHDAKGPMHALAARGLELAGLTSDTALAAYLALPGQRSFDLADLALRYASRRLADSAADSGQLALDMPDEMQAADSLGQRALATAELADALDADLAKRGATRLLADVELPLVRVLADMERAGIAADTGHLADMSSSLAAEVKGAEQAAYAITGHEFNLGSPKQLQEVLFTESSGCRRPSGSRPGTQPTPRR